MQVLSYWTRRTRRHRRLTILATILTSFFYAAAASPDLRHRLSMAFAYTALFFLVWTLFLGPFNVLLFRPNPVSFDLRRDVGIWAAALALVHTAIGLTVHLRGRMWMYFFRTRHPLSIQNTPFGLANYTGLLAALLLLLLLLISNNLSLRTLGTRPWKAIQRSSYFAFIFTVAHGALYQATEKRHLSWTVLFTLLVLAAVLSQALAYLRIKSGQPGGS